MTFDEAQPPGGGAARAGTARLSVIDTGPGAARAPWPAGIPGLGSPAARRRMLETMAIIDAAATSLSVPLLTPADVRAVQSAHETAASCLAGRDQAGLARSSAAFHELLSSRCPNRRLLELLTEELVLVQAISEPAPPDWPRLAGIVAEHARLVRLVQACPGPDEIGSLLRTHRQACY